MNKSSASSTGLSRRDFVKTTSAAALGSAVLGALSIERSAFAAGDDTIKIALIGCGGRGSGAASQALNTGNVKLVAMADAFENTLQTSLANLKEKHPNKVEVPKENQFVGLDGYKKAIALADVAILATSPGFRPATFAEAVRQGKHVFMEKPAATDAPGVRQVLAAAEEAKKKNLKVGVGFQRYHEGGYSDTVKRIQDGAIGDILALRVYWRGGSRAGKPRDPGEGELQYQVRNWYYFTWLSGDHIVEQHCHNIDIGCWIKGGHPIRAHGIGGRQVRNLKENGQIYDHHFVEFEFADGTRMHSECSQIPHLWGNVSEHVLGSKGSAEFGPGQRYSYTPAKEKPVFYKGPKVDPYQVEHNDLFNAIRNNLPYNEAERSAYSTMTAIMGRMATYSGQLVEWDDALNCGETLVPADMTWESTPPVLPNADGFYPVAMPGKTKYCA